MGIANKVRGALYNFFARDMGHKDLARGIGLDVASPTNSGTLRPVAGFGASSSLLYDILAIETALIRRYAEYEEMDEYPEIETCLDLYADDATMDDPAMGTPIWVKVQRNEALGKELNGVLGRIKAGEEAWSVDRALCKYGNVFGEPIITKEDGLVSMQYLPSPTMRRIEAPRDGVLGFVQDVGGRSHSYAYYDQVFARYKGMKTGRVPAPIGQRAPDSAYTIFFDPWEIVHWRLQGKFIRSIYGYPIIEAARNPWKRLTMLEDALLVAKFERTPARHVFYVDVGSMSSKRAEAYMRQVRDKVHRHKYTKNGGATIDQRYAAITQNDDFYVPVRNQRRTTDIDVLQIPDMTETESLDYFRKKLVVSVKVPPSYMGWTDEGSRSMLSSEDIRFARAVMRIQRAHIIGYEEALKLHLAATGREGKGGWWCCMTVPSQILDLARMEVLSATADVSDRLKEMVGTRWVLINIMKMSEVEAEAVMDERLAERRKEGMLDVELRKAEMAEGVAPKSAPMLESLGRPSRGGKPFATSRDWRRDFEGRANPSVERVQSVIKRDPELRRRINRLESLMTEIKGAMRGMSKMPARHPTVDDL